MQFDASIVGGQLPAGTPTVGVAMLGPLIDLLGQRLLPGAAAREALVPGTLNSISVMFSQLSCLGGGGVDLQPIRQSPRKVLVAAHRLSRARLPVYASKFSRRDFTLPQLFAYLILRQFYNLSYGRAEALLADSPSWRRALGLRRTPDHNTSCDAVPTPTAQMAVAGTLDELARAFDEAGRQAADQLTDPVNVVCAATPGGAA